MENERSDTRRFLGKVFKKTVGVETTLKIRKFLALTNGTNQTRSAKIMKSVANKYGDDQLRTAYRENLKYVLKEVSKLVERIPGKSIVTADHGDFLGEGGRHGHNGTSNHPSILREVPWLEIKK